MADTSEVPTYFSSLSQRQQEGPTQLEWTQWYVPGTQEKESLRQPEYRKHFYYKLSILEIKVTHHFIQFSNNYQFVAVNLFFPIWNYPSSIITCNNPPYPLQNKLGSSLLNIITTLY